MKTFIFIFVLVIGFFYYLFTNSDNPKDNLSIEQTSSTLEGIEQQTNQEIKEYATLSTEAPSAIPEDQTFDTIKNILIETSNRHYSQSITLNTNINSYLYTTQEKDQFKQAISSSFNLNYDEVDKIYKKNRLVWDWVNQLKD